MKTHHQTPPQVIPSYMRLAQIIGNPKAEPPIPPIIPVSSSTWWSWVKDGKAPSPIKLSDRVTAWRSTDIYELVEKLSAEGSDNA